MLPNHYVALPLRLAQAESQNDEIDRLLPSLLAKDCLARKDQSSILQQLSLLDTEMWNELVAKTSRTREGKQLSLTTVASFSCSLCDDAT